MTHAAVPPPLPSLVLRFRRPLAVVIYIGLAWLSNVLAFQVRFDGQVPPDARRSCLAMLPWLLALRAGGFMAFGQFRGLWRYASLYDLRNIVLAVLSSSAAFYGLVRWVVAPPLYPRSVYLIDALLLITLLGSLRIARRAWMENRPQAHAKRVLVVGAGDAGEMIVRDMRHNRRHEYVPVGFVDDDPGKRGEQIHGVPVLGGRADIARIVEKVRPADVLIAMPSAPASVRREVVRALQAYHVNITTLPDLREIISGRVAVEQIRSLAIEDLLARPPVGLDPEPVRALISGRSVMVTGAGGSIGSELCRQIAALGPGALALVDRYENSLQAVTNELRDRRPGLDVRPVVGDVTDAARMEAVFSRHAPHIVFHAAAHKHVPLMELSPGEAVKNNVFGTKRVLDAACRHGAERFIFISTDKAVNPSSVMGVSKRVAEMMVVARTGSSSTACASVRFGNVLGSNGSVVPRFLEQIKAGGPVTITHPEMRRYFMLIPEAVQLVLHAGAMAEGGETFVLDMGEQLKVLDLARTLIRLSGFVPDEDTPIAFTGPRPGEKLSEELIASQESLEPSGVEKINRIRQEHPIDAARLEAGIQALGPLVDQSDPAALFAALKRLVPEFNPSGGG